MPKWSSKTKSVLAIAASLATVVALAGCSSSSTNSAASTANTKQTISFVNYTGGAAGAKYVNLVKSFEKKYPKITVQIQTVPGDATYDTLIKSRIQGGSSPDIFEVLNSVPGEKPYVTANLLTDLSTQPWAKDLIPSVAQASNYFGGKTYQFISNVNSVGVFYNKSILSKYGISVPTSWSQFLAAVKTLRSDGVTPLATGAKDGWPLVVQALSMAANEPGLAPSSKETTALADGSASFSSSVQWKSVIDDFTALVKSNAYDPNVSGIDWPSSATQFATGKAAMLIQGDFAVPNVRTANKSLDMGMFPLPALSDGGTPVTSISYGGILAIPSKAKHVAAAELFLSYLAQKSVLTPYLTTAVSLSPIAGVTPKVDPAVQEIIPAINKKSSEYNLSGGLTAATQAALQAGLQSIIAGTGTTSSVLAAMDRAQTS